MSGSTSDKRILIVEDDVSVLEILSEGLRNNGYTVDQATSAEIAQEKLKVFQPHLVITDNDMPGLTGIEMLRNLRKQQNYVTVIFVSGRTDTQFIAETLRDGADDYIRKPFRINELLARVEVALRNNDIRHELLQANLKLQEQIEHDYLSGLFNMRSMYEKIDLEIKRARRGKRHMACVMLDMDNFKTVNDEHDHLFGSFVLKSMGEIIRATMRETDFAARYGGDEFLIVLSETEQTGAIKFCERLREAVENFTFQEGKDSMRLTISLGFAIGGDGIDLDARDLVRRADHNLYVAKEKGRNRLHG